MVVGIRLVEPNKQKCDWNRESMIKKKIAESDKMPINAQYKHKKR